MWGLQHRGAFKGPPDTEGPEENGNHEREPTPVAVSSSRLSTATRRDVGSDGPKEQVQKFRYVEGTNGDNSGYQIFLTTFADLEAAAEDDDERLNAIEAACQSGGDFVRNYYYQYEVSIESYFCAGQQPYTQFYLTSLKSSLDSEDINQPQPQREGSEYPWGSILFYKTLCYQSGFHCQT